MTELAEKAIIGAVIQDASYTMPHLREMDPKYFENKMLGRAFNAFLEMDKQGIAIDQVTMNDHVSPNDYIGLVEMVRDTPSVRNVEHYRDLVMKSYHKRRIKETMADAIKALDVEHIEAIKSDWEGMEAVGARQIDFQSQAMKYLEILETRAKGGEEKFVLGFPTFDYRVPLVRRGEMLTVAARPGKGKTALLLGMMVSAAKSGSKVLYISGEMTIFQMLDRVVSAQTGINSSSIRKGQINASDWPRIINALTELSEGMEIKFVESAGLSFKKIIPAIRSARPDVVFIDFIQRFQPSRGEMKNSDTRASFYSDVANKLRDIAIKEKVVMIVGCQVKREVDGRKGKVRMSDLKESGGIEEASDVVMALNSDDEDPATINRTYTFNVIKNRNGPVLEVPAIFNVSCTKFMEAEE